MSNKFTLKVNADFELKQLGEIMGLPVYIDLAKVQFDDDKMQSFLIAQKMLADFFNPPDPANDTESMGGEAE